MIGKSPYMYPMPSDDVRNSISGLFSAAPCPWVIRALVPIQTENARSAVACSSAINATTDAGVQKQKIENIIFDKIQPVQTSASCAFFTSSPHHGVDCETNSLAARERSEIGEVEAENSKLDVAMNYDKAGTVPDNSVHATVY